MTQSPKIQKPKPKEKLSDKEQSERFKDAARALGADADINSFPEAIEKILRKAI